MKSSVKVLVLRARVYRNNFSNGIISTWTINWYTKLQNCFLRVNTWLKLWSAFHKRLIKFHLYIYIRKDASGYKFREKSGSLFLGESIFPHFKCKLAAYICMCCMYVRGVPAAVCSWKDVYPTGARRSELFWKRENTEATSISCLEKRTAGSDAQFALEWKEKQTFAKRNVIAILSLLPIYPWI